MKKLNSSSTFFLKKVFPIIWFGLLSAFVIGVLVVGGATGPSTFFIIMAALMAAFGYLLMKGLVFGLIDEVYDEGNSLLFRNSGKEVRVNFRDIKSVSYQIATKPPRVDILIGHNTDFGNTLTFSPPKSMVPFKKNKDIEALIERINQARN